MAKQDLLDRLREAVGTAGCGWSTEPIAEMHAVDALLKTPCFAAFFAVVEERSDLEAIHAAAQSEISGVFGNPSWPRDLELILLAVGETPPDPASVRRIMDDRYICRKFILNVNGNDIRNVLTNLPFWPATDLLRKSSTSIAAGVQESVMGYDPRLIADFASRSPAPNGSAKKSGRMLTLYRVSLW